MSEKPTPKSYAEVRRQLKKENQKLTDDEIWEFSLRMQDLTSEQIFNETRKLISNAILRYKRAEGLI